MSGNGNSELPSPAPGPGTLRVAAGGEGLKPVLMMASEAVAEAAIRAGCRFYAGYPITPSTEILEWMTKRMPEAGGVAMIANSELEGINMVAGAAGCGVRAMIASTSTAISLMQETIAEMANMENPAVIVNMCRGMLQGDYNQSTRGGGHGDYRLIVLAPSTAQEAVDLTFLAFYLADKYRNPVMILGDVILGHTAEPVVFRPLDESDLPPKTWATTGAKGRHANRMTMFGGSGLSTDITTSLSRAGTKQPIITASETRVETLHLDDSELAIVAYGTAARFAQAAIARARAEGIKVGLVRPITLWPFPTQAVVEAAERIGRLVVFELNYGQMVDDVRAAVFGRAPVEWFGGMGQTETGYGTIWTVDDILNEIRRRAGAREGVAV